MKYTSQICFIFYFCFGIICSEDTESSITDTASTGDEQSVNDTNTYKNTPECWLTLRARPFIRDMNKLDTEYAKVRQDVQHYFDRIKFDKTMLEAVLSDGAVAQREVHKERPGHATIPSGLNLGGLCMVRMPYSVIFFHRMKLRQDTNFRIDILQNDMENMALRVHFALNTLCLKGAYDRLMTDRDPAVLIYTPSFGELEVYLEDVLYAIEGRYRVIKNRLAIELVLSSITSKNVILKYKNSTISTEPIKLERGNMGDFLHRLKTDLDEWVKDYFNDYLIQTSLLRVPSIAKLKLYDQKKAIEIAKFTDDALEKLKKRIKNVGGNALHIPRFKIIASHGLTLELKDGILQGLNTMHRRSVATSVARRKNLRYVDTIIGFSDLKISYKYEISFPANSQSAPPLSGLVIMSANEVTALLSLGLLKDPETVDLDIDFIHHNMGSDAITVEGGANVLISNFKHLLQHEIATIMASTLTYGITMLRSLPRCEPFLPGLIKKKNEAENVNMDSDLVTSEDGRDKDDSVSNTISSEGKYVDNKPHKINTTMEKIYLKEEMRRLNKA